MKALILAGLLLSTAIGFAEPPRFLLAVKEEKDAHSTEKGWSVDIGEVYQFVRKVSASEYNGGTPDSSDQGYVEVQIDDIKVVSLAANFVPVEDKDLLAATTKYSQEVAQHKSQNEVETVLGEIDEKGSTPMSGRDSETCEGKLRAEIADLDSNPRQMVRERIRARIADLESQRFLNHAEQHCDYFLRALLESPVSEKQEQQSNDKHASDDGYLRSQIQELQYQQNIDRMKNFMQNDH
jgi:hypothetical protein